MIVSSSVLIDFILSSGTARLSGVKQLVRGTDERFADFYRPVRDAIIELHAKELTTTVLDDLVMSVQDPREKRVFPKATAGYKRFLRSARMKWFEPPMRDYPLGPLTVRVNPELGLLIDGRPHGIKLYFRGDPITPQRVLLTNEILAGALSATWPGTVWATLDVRRAKLYPHRPKSDVGLLLCAEAACLDTLYRGLGGRTGL